MSNGSFWKLSTDKEAGASTAAGGERLEMPTEQPSQKGCTVELCARWGMAVLGGKATRSSWRKAAGFGQFLNKYGFSLIFSSFFSVFPIQSRLLHVCVAEAGHESLILCPQELRWQVLPPHLGYAVLGMAPRSDAREAFHRRDTHSA